MNHNEAPDEPSKKPGRYRFPIDLLHYGLLIGGCLLVAIPLYSLPGSIEVVQSHERWHRFEVRAAWLGIYLTPVLVLLGAAMIWKAIRPTTRQFKTPQTGSIDDDTKTPRRAYVVVFAILAICVFFLSLLACIAYVFAAA
jgi:cytochrome b561